MFIVKQWNLKPGDEVEWSLEVCDSGELIAAVRRTAPVKRSKK
jgi:hypothetical protein